MGIIRMTKSVETLLSEFNKEAGGISAIELVKRLNKKLNKTTIYRVLEKLEDDGVLHSFLSKKGIRWYAKCIGCSDKQHIDVHPHFQCLSCGKMDCLNLEIQIPKIPHRKISHSHVLIQGICHLCCN